MMKCEIRLVLGASCCIALCGCASPAHSQRSTSDALTVEYTPSGGEAYHGLIQYRARDSKPAIMNPELLTAEEAFIAGGTKVIGVILEGEARAYPLFILNNHQIVNDTVGGVPICASW